MKEYNVITYDFNSRKFEKYDVIPYFLGAYEKMKKSKRPKTFEDFKKFVQGESMYQFWARCEYEVILMSWPGQDKTEKIDVHYQIMQNLDLVTEIVMTECKEYEKKLRRKKREEKEQGCNEN